MINRLASPEEAKNLSKEAEGLAKLSLNEREICDLEMLASGAFSPLEGFMTGDDYRSVVESMRLEVVAADRLHHGFIERVHARRP